MKWCESILLSNHLNQQRVCKHEKEKSSDSRQTDNERRRLHSSLMRVLTDSVSKSDSKHWVFRKSLMQTTEIVIKQTHTNSNTKGKSIKKQSRQRGSLSCVISIFLGTVLLSILLPVFCCTNDKEVISSSDWSVNLYSTCKCQAVLQSYMIHAQHKVSALQYLFGVHHLMSGFFRVKRQDLRCASFVVERYVWMISLRLIFSVLLLSRWTLSSHPIVFGTEKFIKTIIILLLKILLLVWTIKHHNWVDRGNIWLSWLWWLLLLKKSC
jgi:hypothetical protein